MTKGHSMTRPLILACLALLFSAAVAPAAPILSFVNLPTDYTPGSSFTFDVALTGAENLSAYNIDLFLTAESGEPRVDFAFTAIESPLAYVFGISTGFFLASPTDAPDPYRLNLSDFLLIGEVDTVAGVNDLVARVTVQTSTNVGGLQIGFDPTFLELLDQNLNPIPDFSSMVIAPPATVPEVPEPHSLALLLTGLLSAGVLQARRRFHASR